MLQNAEIPTCMLFHPPFSQLSLFIVVIVGGGGGGGSGVVSRFGLAVSRLVPTSALLFLQKLWSVDTVL